MIKYKIIGGLYYGNKRKETNPQSSNDRRKTKHHPPAASMLAYFLESNYDSLYCCLLMNFQNGEVIDLLSDWRKQDIRKIALQ